MGLFKKRKKLAKTQESDTKLRKMTSLNFTNVCANSQPKRDQRCIESRQLYLKDHNEIRDVFDKF